MDAGIDSDVVGKRDFYHDFFHWFTVKGPSGVLDLQDNEYAGKTVYDTLLEGINFYISVDKDDHIFSEKDSISHTFWNMVIAHYVSVDGAEWLEKLLEPFFNSDLWDEQLLDQLLYSIDPIHGTNVFLILNSFNPDAIDRLAGKMLKIDAPAIRNIYGKFFPFLIDSISGENIAAIVSASADAGDHFGIYAVSQICNFHNLSKMYRDGELDILIETLSEKDKGFKARIDALSKPHSNVPDKVKNQFVQAVSQAITECFATPVSRTR